MPRTKIDKTAPLEEPELREQTWRVLREVDVDEAGESTWHEVGELTGAGTYGFRPDARELGAEHGAGRYMLLEVDPERSHLFGFELEVGMEPSYFDAKWRREYEQRKAEEELAAEAEELESDA